MDKHQYNQSTISSAQINLVTGSYRKRALSRKMNRYIKFITVQLVRTIKYFLPFCRFVTLQNLIIRNKKSITTFPRHLRSVCFYCSKWLKCTVTPAIIANKDKKEAWCHSILKQCDNYKLARAPHHRHTILTNIKELTCSA